MVMDGRSQGLLVVTLPACWASALINGNLEDLAYEDPSEAARCAQWSTTNDDLQILDVGAPYTDRFDGLITSVSDFSAGLVSCR